MTMLPTTTRRTLRVVSPVAIVAFIAMLPLLAVPIPLVLPGPTYAPGALHMLAYAMTIAALALSYHLVLGLSGLLSFGHTMFFAAGAYGLAIGLDLLADLGSGAAFVIAIVTTVAATGLLAATVGAVALRATGISFALVTLAFAQAANVLIRRNTADATGGEEGLRLTDGVPDVLIGVANTRNLYWLVLGTLVLVYAVATWVERSRSGHVAAAARENEERVRVLGLSPYRTRLAVFAIAGMLAALAGVVFAILQSGTNPRIVSVDFSLTLLVIVVLGGLGHRWGAIAGALVYTVLDQRLATLASSAAIDGLPAVLRIPLSEPLFILGMLFVAVVMFLPGGLAGAVANRTGTTSTRPG